MNCMKCGREIPEGQVFCQECLAVMDAYPVNPGTHIQLPQRPARVEDKKALRQIPPVEQIRQLKRAIRWLCLTVGVLLAAVAILALLLVQNLTAPTTQAPIGRNYTVTTTHDG